MTSSENDQTTERAVARVVGAELSRPLSKALLLLVISGILLLLVVVHTPGLNGPDYWRWTWRRLDGALVYPLFLVAALPFFAGQVIHSRRGSVVLPLALISGTLVALMIAGTYAQFPSVGFSRIAHVVESPSATSYWTDALLLPGAGV